MKVIFWSQGRPYESHILVNICKTQNAKYWLLLDRRTSPPLAFRLVLASSLSKEKLGKSKNPLIKSARKLNGMTAQFLRLFTREVTSSHECESEIRHNIDLGSFTITELGHRGSRDRNPGSNVQK